MLNWRLIAMSCEVIWTPLANMRAVYDYGAPQPSATYYNITKVCGNSRTICKVLCFLVRYIVIWCVVRHLLLLLQTLFYAANTRFLYTFESKLVAVWGPSPKLLRSAVSAAATVKVRPWPRRRCSRGGLRSRVASEGATGENRCGEIKKCNFRVSFILR